MYLGFVLWWFCRLLIEHIQGTASAGSGKDALVKTVARSCETFPDSNA